MGKGGSGFEKTRRLQRRKTRRRMAALRISAWAVATGRCALSPQRRPREREQAEDPTVKPHGSQEGIV
jgi:hypothetical protein